MATGSSARTTEDRRAEVKEDEQDDRAQRIQRRLFVAVLQQIRVVIKLDRRAGDVRIDRLQLLDKLFLIFALPHILFWDTLQSDTFR